MSAQGCLFGSGLFLAQGCFWLRLFLAQGCFWLRAVYFSSRLSRVAHPPDERLSPLKTANLALEHLILQPLSSARDGPSKSHKGWAQIFIAPLPPGKNALASPSKSLMGH